MSTFIIWAMLFNTASCNIGTTAASKRLVTETPRFSRPFFADCQTNDLQIASHLRIRPLGSESQLV
jgi:hypothetical protein